MRAREIEAIRKLLSSAQPDDLRHGLAKVREVVAGAPAEDVEALFEMVATLFYLDPLDRPDLAPVLDEAITTAAGFGPRFIPALLSHLDAGDVKAQIAVGHALGRMGAVAVSPLVTAYQATMDMDRRSFIVYALGKISAPEVVNAVSVAVDGAGARDRELRDTATRTIGKMAAAIAPGKLSELTRRSILEALRRNLSDPSPAIRAKAVRSLGKLAEHGHLAADEKEDLATALRRIAGQDKEFDWDRAFVVRREAEEALRHLVPHAASHAGSGAPAKV